MSVVAQTQVGIVRYYICVVIRTPFTCRTSAVKWIAFSLRRNWSERTRVMFDAFAVFPARLALTWTMGVMLLHNIFQTCVLRKLCTDKTATATIYSD